MNARGELVKLIYCHEYRDEAAGTMRDCDAIADAILASAWLAQHDAEVAGKALRDAADELAPGNGYALMFGAMSRSHVAANAVRWIRDRATTTEGQR